jgi:sigma-B regulation protein RsbU (phosphoserine phosphatase)
MSIVEAQLTAKEVLNTFHRDEPYLFLGAAFSTASIVSAAFCVLRRRFDALLVCLAVFSFLYGQRLWLDADLLRLTLPDTEFFTRLRTEVDYLVPIPGFIFFYVAGFLGRRGKPITIALSLLFLGLTIGTVFLGPLPLFREINNSVVIVALIAVMARSVRQDHRDRDSAAIRIGLGCFVAGALWDNIVGIRFMPSKIEPLGFAVFLASLGLVAARRTLRRDHELGEIQNELELARRIQLSILPPAFPESVHFQVAARYVPMTSVAGDFYDFLVAGDDQAGLLIADVSGHGVPAALIASMVKMAATSQRANAADPEKILTGMNAALCGNTQNQFITAAYVHLDAATREFRYSAAGHPAMLLLRNGQVTEISENGFILAVSPQAAFTTATHALVPGDRLVLYTDGILEARDARGELFGEESLYAVVRETASQTAADAADRIVSTVQAWAKSQDDDLTLLICDYQNLSAREG